LLIEAKIGAWRAVSTSCGARPTQAARSLTGTFLPTSSTCGAATVAPTTLLPASRLRFLGR
jgi:hypothetical protein